MDIVSVLLLAPALSMDAFAASLCLGLSVGRVKLIHRLKAGAYFGFFQGIMPLAGYFLASVFKEALEKADHWIAFLLLTMIGVNMLREAGQNRNEELGEEAFSAAKMLIAALATSVDALAVGASLAMSGGENIFFSACVIALATFAFSFAGVGIGNYFGVRLKRKAEAAGGWLLILIGFRILSSHLSA